MSERGALMPPLATLPVRDLLARLDKGGTQMLGARELLPCPFCGVDQMRGKVVEIPRVRLPVGVGSDIAAWAAELAADRVSVETGVEGFGRGGGTLLFADVGVANCGDEGDGDKDTCLGERGRKKPDRYATERARETHQARG